MPASVCIKLILYKQKRRKLLLRISSKTSFFLQQHKLSTLVDMALHFPQRQQFRSPFHSFSSLCLHSWWTDFSVCILIVTSCWFKVVWSHPEVFYKKVFLEISQNSQENTCARVSFLKICRPEACNFIKNEALAQMFSCNFVKFLRTPFLQNTSTRLLLYGFSLSKLEKLSSEWEKLKETSLDNKLESLIAGSWSLLNRRVTRENGGMGGLSCPFSKIEKKCPNFGEKMPFMWPCMR